MPPWWKFLKGCKLDSGDWCLCTLHQSIEAGARADADFRVLSAAGFMERGSDHKSWVRLRGGHTWRELPYLMEKACAVMRLTGAECEPCGGRGEIFKSVLGPVSNSMTLQSLGPGSCTICNGRGKVP